jgi:hypothetical protein
MICFVEPPTNAPGAQGVTPAAVSTQSGNNAERIPRQVRAFQCFQAGTQTASNGVSYTLTQADLKRLADGYNDNDMPRVQLQISHARNAVTVGTVLGLVAYGAALYTIAEVQQQAIDASRAGKYTGVSISLNLDSGNGYTLAHIALLDRQKPAVKGMVPLDFSAVRDAPIVSFSEPLAQRYELTTAALDMQAATGLPFITAAISIQHAIRHTT